MDNSDKKKYRNKKQKNHLLVIEKGDVGMAKHFSKKHGNKGRAFDYPVSAI